MDLPDQLTNTVSSFFPTPDEIPAEQAIKPIHQREILINGELRTWHGPVQQVYSPVCIRDEAGVLTKMPIGSYPLATENEALEALDAAVRAYDYGRGNWPTMGVSARIRHLEDFTFKMIGCRQEVVNLLMWEIGKTLADSEKEFDRTVEYMHATVQSLKILDNKSSGFEIAQGIAGQIRRAPLGVVLCMGPFNYPLNETFTTMIPALIMGNTILFKPPKYGTLLFCPLLKAFQEAFPAGVVNTVYGRGATVAPTLMKSGKIDCLALIGSSRVADQLIKLHPKTNRLRPILSLDAKNAAIILKDADLEETVRECVLGALTFNGQRCTAIKIIYVHRSLADAFLALLSQEVNKLKMGMPWEKGVQITPLPEPGKPAYIKECLDEAISMGARIYNEGGGETCETLIKPAVVYPVDNRMKLFREEQFAPVIPVLAFDEIEEPINYLIHSDHGQQVSIFGNSHIEIASLLDQLVNLVCRVNVNAQCQRGPDVFPFTGRKDSAVGTLSVDDALRAFSVRTMVATKLNTKNKLIFNTIVHENESKFLNTQFIF